MLIDAVVINYQLRVAELLMEAYSRHSCRSSLSYLASSIYIHEIIRRDRMVLLDVFIVCEWRVHSGKPKINVGALSVYTVSRNVSGERRLELTVSVTEHKLKS